jgi:ribonuclease HI
MSEAGVLTIHTDGAARGNPGPAAFAYIIEQNGSPVIEEKGKLGRATNNVAEYMALVRALEHAARLGARRVHILSDSELMVKQMKGQYQVKSEELLALYKEAKKLAGQFEEVNLQHVRREHNSRADRLCNEALDGAGTSAPAPARHKKTSHAVAGQRKEAVREEALLCLKAAAAQWARGDGKMPPPEQVWDQLWSILEEGGVLRPARPQ